LGRHLYGDAFDPGRERVFTRAACAELLIDAGAVVTPPVCEGILESRARGLLQLFRRKGLLPRTLKFFAAPGDLDAVRTELEENGNDLAVNTMGPCLRRDPTVGCTNMSGPERGSRHEYPAMPGSSAASRGGSSNRTARWQACGPETT
jgi:hypothetical protein